MHVIPKNYRRKKNVKKGLKKIVASFLTVAMTAVALDFSGGGSGSKG